MAEPGELSNSAVIALGKYKKEQATACAEAGSYVLLHVVISAFLYQLV